MLVTNFPEIADSVQEWLRGEHDYQFAKFDGIYGDELRERRNFIANTELENKWQRNVVLRKGDALLLANQQVLKVCAAARAVLIYDVCLEGGIREEASKNTFEMISQHFKQLEPEMIDENLLYERFETAFPSRNPEDIFKRAGGFAIAGVAQYQAEMGEIILPQPGLSSGNV